MIHKQIRRLGKKKKRNARDRSPGNMLYYLRNASFQQNMMLMKYFDWPLFLLAFGLSLFGLVCILCATSAPIATEGLRFIDILRSQPLGAMNRQFVALLAGLAGMAAVMYFHYQLYDDLSYLIYVVNLGLLVFVLLLERGRGNVAGWISISENRTFQPSEVGKIAIIVALASEFAKLEKPIETVRDFTKLLLYFGIPLLLILAQPDVGTALVYIAIFGGMLFMSGASLRLIGGILALGILGVVVIIMGMSMVGGEDFRTARLIAFINPESVADGAGLNTIRSRIAIGSGGFYGKGMFAQGNLSSLNYIPEDHTDFIFAVVGETFGMVGSVALVLSFMLLLFRMLKLSREAQDPFGRYVIVGVICMLLFHITENIGMVIGLLPITGIPLPFISYGGTNLLASMMGVGLVLNITSRSRAKIPGFARGRMQPTE